MPYRICFVCSGNICRSPMAETVLCQQASSRGLEKLLEVDSAGIAADVGFDMDRRARRVLERRGYTLPRHTARQFRPEWLKERDLVVAMDRGHLRWLEHRAPIGPEHAAVRLLLSYPGNLGPDAAPDLEDPWLGDESEFESCLDLIEAGCAALLDELTPSLVPAERGSG